MGRLHKRKGGGYKWTVENLIPHVLMKATNDKQKLTKEELAKRKENEPRIQSNNLKCPAHLSDEAKKEWRRIVKLYRELSCFILCDLDSTTLEVYCNALVTYRAAVDKVEETAAVYVSKRDSRPRKNPWQTVANEAAEQMRKYAEILLLNPVSRARVGVASAKKENRPLSPFEAYDLKYNK